MTTELRSPIGGLEAQNIDSRRAKMTEVTNLIYDSLVLQPSQEMSNLPEEIFVNYFLAFFSGQRKIDEEVLKKWISVSGAPGKRVRIIDQRGNELFQVPPLADSSIIDHLSAKPGESITDIVNMYVLESANIKVIAEKKLMSSLEKRFQTILKTSDKYEAYMREWDDIFARYGIDVKADPNVKVDSDKISEDDYDYD